MVVKATEKTGLIRLPDSKIHTSHQPVRLKSTLSRGPISHPKSTQDMYLKMNMTVLAITENSITEKAHLKWSQPTTAIARS
jgi:hypothetical protein